MLLLRPRGLAFLAQSVGLRPRPSLPCASLVRPPRHRRFRPLLRPKWLRQPSRPVLCRQAHKEAHPLAMPTGLRAALALLVVS